MTEQEGVIKFSLVHKREACLSADAISEIESWRVLCRRLGLIGQDNRRYDGYGFGNISQRYSADAFVISGTQTGGKQSLAASDYALVTSCFPAQNSIQSKGLIKPSSEAMTHGQIYLLDAAVNCVIHAHCPEIWQHSNQLKIASTGREIAYGTVEMAAEVEALFSHSAVKQEKLFVMKGHLDGVVAFGQTFDQAFSVISNALARALQINNSAIQNSKI